MTAKRYRGFGQHLGICLVATLVLGACATGAHAQVQFSAWPVCNDGAVPFSLGAFIWNNNGSPEGFGTFQPIPAKPESYEVASLAVVAVALDSQSQDLPLASLTLGHVIGYLGNPPAPGTSPGIPAFSIPVALSPQMFTDTGASSFPGATIWRVVIPIPPQTIPAQEVLNIAFVFELDPAVGGAAVMEGDLLDNSITDAWVLSFTDDSRSAGNFGSGCDDIMALELYGPAPIPTVSEWGLVAMTLLMMTAGTLVCRARMAKPVAG